MRLWEIQKILQCLLDFSGYLRRDLAEIFAKEGIVPGQYLVDDQVAFLIQSTTSPGEPDPQGVGISFHQLAGDRNDDRTFQAGYREFGRLYGQARAPLPRLSADARLQVDDVDVPLLGKGGGGHFFFRRDLV